MAPEKLKILKIRLPSHDLSPNLYSFKFHDDGFIDSIVEYTRKVNKIHGFNREFEYYNKEDYKVDWDKKEKMPVGRFLVRPINKVNFIHIFYLDQSPILNIKTRAHEEYHVAEFLDLDYILSEKMFKEQDVRIDFSKIEESEVRAGLAEVFTLYSYGFNPEDLPRLNYEKKDFKKALEIYKQSKSTAI